VLEKERIIDVADVERVAREIHILKLVRHPNIIQLYEVWERKKFNEKNYYSIMIS
jgi:5'-AMP-activated protein kinase catalytic alpha subunit